MKNVKIASIGLHEENLKVLKALQNRRIFIVQTKLICSFFRLLEELMNDDDIESPEKFWDIWILQIMVKMEKSVKSALKIAEEQEMEEIDDEEEVEIDDAFEEVTEDKKYLKRTEDVLNRFLNSRQLKRFKALERKRRALVSFNLVDELFDLVRTSRSRSVLEREVHMWLEASLKLATKTERASIKKVKDYVESKLN